MSELRYTSRCVAAVRQLRELAMELRSSSEELRTLRQQREDSGAEPVTDSAVQQLAGARA